MLLPHLAGRPISLKRYPDGVEGTFFYEKQCPSHAPSWIRTVKVGKAKGGHVDYCVINELASLVLAAYIANLEIHTFQHRASGQLNPPGGVQSGVFLVNLKPRQHTSQLTGIGTYRNFMFRDGMLDSFVDDRRHRGQGHNGQSCGDQQEPGRCFWKIYGKMPRTEMQAAPDESRSCRKGRGLAR